MSPRLSQPPPPPPPPPPSHTHSLVAKSPRSSPHTTFCGRHSSRQREIGRIRDYFNLVCASECVWCMLSVVESYIYTGDATVILLLLDSSYPFNNCPFLSPPPTHLRLIMVNFVQSTVLALSTSAGMPCATSTTLPESRSSSHLCRGNAVWR